jgi:hypothetical protein
MTIPCFVNQASFDGKISLELGAFFFVVHVRKRKGMDEEEFEATYGVSSQPNTAFFRISFE